MSIRSWVSPPRSLARPPERYQWSPRSANGFAKAPWPDATEPLASGQARRPVRLHVVGPVQLETTTGRSPPGYGGWPRDLLTYRGRQVW